jgi:YD repeat-containing protein
MDALGRISSVVEDPNGLNYATNYSYDPLDNLIQVTQGQQTRQFVRNTLGWLMQSTQPESGTTNYGYDGVGNVIQKIDARGVAAGYTYDALDRLKQKSYSDGTPTVTYSYDTGSAYSVGRLQQVSNANSLTSYTGYDPLGRVTATNQVTAGQDYSFSYSYNRAGALVSETYPSGRVVATSYDDANRVSAVTGTFNGQQMSYVSGVTYASHGAPSSFTYGNQLARTLGYNNRLQLSSYQDALQNAPTSILFSVSANWGAANNNGSLQSETLYEGGPRAR